MTLKKKHPAGNKTIVRAEKYLSRYCLLFLGAGQK